MTWPFIHNQLYNRRSDIHAPYGGQQQGGIATPAGHQVVFLFTGHGAAKIGYGDAWQPDGSLRYTGEGQVGPMRMTNGNLAIRDHVANGEDLLLFEKSKSGGPVRYVGQFVCAGWETELQPDVNGADRDAIVFHLVPIEHAADAAALSSAPAPAGGDMMALRKAAYAAATAKASAGQATKTVYERSAVVRSYVLARANGTCESCNAPAPFTSNTGSPFLEAHHIRRVSDGGPDDPGHMAGVCPNCHRRAHYGADAQSINAIMAAQVAAKEAALSN